MYWSKSPVVLTAMSFSFGGFIATCFATAISLAETKVAVTGAVTSKFVFGAAIGWMTLPFLTGYLFDSNLTQHLVKFERILGIGPDDKKTVRKTLFFLSLRITNGVLMVSFRSTNNHVIFRFEEVMNIICRDEFPLH